jgi:competence protein ComEA
MFKQISTAALGLWLTTLAWGQLDLNQATEMELDGLKGSGPALTKTILAERNASAFRNWADVLQRVKGIGPKKAASLSEQGVRVQGEPFTPFLRSTPSKN